MAERAIEDGFVDCPKSYEGKDDNVVICYFGEERPAQPAAQEAEPVAEET